MTHEIDLRSDTVTRPTPDMRQAMAQADVGDDVYGEDPTVNRLQARMAELLGKEAALFVPSGTMANQVAIRVHTRPGDELIIERSGHSYLYETGALAGISSVQAHTVEGDRGILSPEAVEAAIRPRPDHYARSRIVIIENTSNGGGGTVYSLERIQQIAAVAKTHDLIFHLDGARLFNAHVATDISLASFASACDSVSVCFSKGLGAPVGSIVAGSCAFIEEAHRQRKMLGGGMRQVGILAAAALYALDHHVERLADDHRSLRKLAEGLAKIDGLRCEPAHFPTNIAYCSIDRERLSALELVEKLANVGVLINPTGPKEIRVVTHLDVDNSAIDDALERWRQAMES